jgi:Ubiquitin family
MSLIPSIIIEGIYIMSSSSCDFDLDFKCINPEINTTLTVSPAKAIKEIKNSLRTNVPVLNDYTIILIYYGKKMNDSDTIETIGIQPGICNYAMIAAINPSRNTTGDTMIRIVWSGTGAFIGEFDQGVSDAIFLLKEKISKKIKIDPRIMLLSRSGWKVDNDETVASRNIQYGETLYLSICGRHVSMDKEIPPPSYETHN